jgi:thiamine kinase-like enzyme
MPMDATKIILDAANHEPPDRLKQAVQDAGFLTSDAQWTCLQGGRTNRVWRAAEPWTAHPSTGVYIVKLYTPEADTPLFRNDPQAEVAILTLLSNRGLSPDLLLCGQTPSGSFIVYRYQVGQAWHAGTDRIARILRKVHDTVDPPPLPFAPDGSAELIAQTLGFLAEIDDHRADQLRRNPPRQHVEPSFLRRLLHGDPVPGNVICDDDDLSKSPVLIDWQCPTLGDPVLDLAMFLSPAMQHIGRGKPLSRQEEEDFLSVYNDQAAMIRLSKLRAILHWRMAAYCLWKITGPKSDVDYAKGYDLELAALAALG